MMPPRLFLIVLSVGHMLADVNAGAVVALLPYLRDAYGLSYAALGGLLMLSNAISSVAQPLLGLLSDRTHQRWLLPVGIAVGGLGVAATGWLPLQLVYLAVAVSSLGMAAYHPEGSRVARHLGGERPATAMSTFSSGGNVGFALGPVAVSWALTAGWGIRGTILLFLPALAGTVAFVALLSTLALWEKNAANSIPNQHAVGPSLRWGSGAILFAISTLRSLFQCGLLAYLPFYYIDSLGGTPQAANQLLFVFLASGVAGTLLGGYLADRLGTRTVLLASLGLVTLLYPLLLSVGRSLIFPAVALVGLTLVSTFGVTVVMSQDYLPRHVGLASGLNLGLPAGVAGMGAAILGAIADHRGILPTLWLMESFPLLAAALTYLLPDHDSRRRRQL